MNNICIISFYKFVKILDLENIKKQIENICYKCDTKGTILIASEGINGTIEGTHHNIKKFLEQNEDEVHLYELAEKRRKLLRKGITNFSSRLILSF